MGFGVWSLDECWHDGGRLPAEDRHRFLFSVQTDMKEILPSPRKSYKV